MGSIYIIIYRGKTSWALYIIIYRGKTTWALYITIYREQDNMGCLAEETCMYRVKLVRLDVDWDGLPFPACAGDANTTHFQTLSIFLVQHLQQKVGWFVTGV